MVCSEHSNMKLVKTVPKACCVNNILDFSLESINIHSSTSHKTLK